MTDKERITALECKVLELENRIAHLKTEASKNLRRALLAESMLENTNHSFKKVEKV